MRVAKEQRLYEIWVEQSKTQRARIEAEEGKS